MPQARKTLSFQIHAMQGRRGKAGHGAKKLRIEEFLDRCKHSGGSERSNFQTFANELCDVLDLPKPAPATEVNSANSCCFEHPVTFIHTGSQTRGFVDLYRAGHFVMAAKQGVTQQDNAQSALLADPSKATRKGRGTRGTRGWDDTMLRARSQADGYARAVSRTDGCGPCPPGQFFAAADRIARPLRTCGPSPDRPVGNHEHGRLFPGSAHRSETLQRRAAQGRIGNAPVRCTAWPADRRASRDWREVEPAIFGTLLERALDKRQRHKPRAHYTPRAYVERLVVPTIVDPLRADWRIVQAAAMTLANGGQMEQARDTVRAFHAQLCEIRVLDPACGSGNVLYVALELMKRLEGEVTALLAELGEERGALSLAGHTVDPHQFLGIELNPWAAAVAELVLWIGFLQWHFRTHGKASPAEPVLRDFKNIENRDSVLTCDGTRPPAARHQGVSVQFFTDAADCDAVLDFVIQGNSAQMDDPAFVQELAAWLRLRPARAVVTGDGLFSACSGNPVLPEWIGPTLFGMVFRKAPENDKYRDQIRSSAGIAVFVGDRADPEHWIKVGRSFQRFALQATALGIRNAHVNQPVEVPSVRSEFARWLGMPDTRPDLVIRFGRAPAMPMSLRRPVSAVLV